MVQRSFPAEHHRNITPMTAFLHRFEGQDAPHQSEVIATDVI
jgi:hypothetical protein